MANVDKSSITFMKYNIYGCMSADISDGHGRWLTLSISNKNVLWMWVEKTELGSLPAIRRAAKQLVNRKAKNR